MPPYHPTVSGLRAVTALLEAGRVEKLWLDGGATNPRLLALRKLAQEQGVPYENTSKDMLSQIDDNPRHQGVVAIPQLPNSDFKSILQQTDQNLIVLDGVTDTGNLGAVVRTARAFGVAAVIAPQRRSAPLAAAARAAAGALAYVPIVRVTNTNQALRQIQAAGWTTVGASGDAEQSLFVQPLPSPLCWVFGDESIGLRHLSRRYCDFLVRIPTVHGDGGCLNVSAACAICLAVTAARQLSALQTNSDSI